MLISVLGWAMLAFSLLAVCDGLPRQIWNSFRTRTTPRVLRRFVAWALAAYLLRAVYAAATGSWLIALAAIPGAAGMAVLLWQSFRYPQVTVHQALVTDGAFLPSVVPNGATITAAYMKGGRLIVEATGEQDGYIVVLDGFLQQVSESTPC